MKSLLLNLLLPLCEFTIAASLSCGSACKKDADCESPIACMSGTCADDPELGTSLCAGEPHSSKAKCGQVASLGYFCDLSKDCAHGEFHVGEPIDCLTPDQCAGECDRKDDCKSFIMFELNQRKNCTIGQGLCVLKSAMCSAVDLADNVRTIYYARNVV